ncbi:MAG: aminodeoxychorismate/anthranilate synthase component II [Veillonella sp.]|uniref:anthranilate synthase component II n=1 Tax=Veillonella sp. TaxID=1926307 RepID=UPI0025F50A8C|nr:aminodeoxychorismate/anthranilate synthase component II [Veillonella sp.]MBE6080614.1 aminodeoxychorismate/anthranilate synthase component II [Veillonella sp.]
MYLIVDNYDSFTYNLANLVAETGRHVDVRPCDSIDLKEITAMNPDGIIISPGPKGPADALQSLAIVQEFKDKLPILGVCLGMQILAYTAGATVSRGQKPMHGKVTAIHHEGHGLFKDLPKTFDVTRYHSLVVQQDTLPPDYRVDAVSDDGALMAMSHQKLPLFGLQFHPEALLSEYGSELIQAFCQYAEKGAHAHV